MRVRILVRQGQESVTDVLRHDPDLPHSPEWERFIAAGNSERVMSAGGGSAGKHWLGTERRGFSES